jgi:hypothetical protein
MKRNLFSGLTALVLAIGFVLVGCGDDPIPAPPTPAEQAAALEADLGDGAKIDPDDPTKVNVSGEVTVTGTVPVGAGVTLALSEGGGLTGDGTIELAGALVDERTGTDGYFGALAGDTFTIEVGAGATLSTKDEDTNRPLFGAPSDVEAATTPYFQLDGPDKVELVGTGAAVTIKVTAGTVELNRTEANASWTPTTALPLEIAPGATLVVKGGNLNVDDDALVVNGTLEIKSGSHLARPAALFTNGSVGIIRVYEGGSIVRLFGTTGGNARASLVVGSAWALETADKAASYFVWNGSTGTDYIAFDLGRKAIIISDGSKLKLGTPSGTANFVTALTFNGNPTVTPASGTWQFLSLTVTTGTLPGYDTNAKYIIETGGVVSGTGLGTSVATHTWNSSWN